MITPYQKFCELIKKYRLKYSHIKNFNKFYEKEWFAEKIGISLDRLYIIWKLYIDRNYVKRR